MHYLLKTSTSVAHAINAYLCYLDNILMGSDIDNK